MKPCRLILLALGLLCSPVSSPQAETARLAYLIEQTEYHVGNTRVVRKSHGEDVARALRTLGFTVQRYRNLTAEEFASSLAEISRDSHGSEATIIYVSGYALGHSAGGRVLPTDIDPSAPLSNGISLAQLLDVPQGRDLGLVIVDAPEDARTSLGLNVTTPYSPFLSEPEALPRNTMGVITSVAPWGAYAGLRPVDRADIFARNFKLFLERTGRTVSEFLNKVAISTFYDSQHRQFPRVFGTLDKPYHMTRRDEVSDITAWLELLAKPSKENLRAFMTTYPDSIYVEFARQKLKDIEQN